MNKKNKKGMLDAMPSLLWYVILIVILIGIVIFSWDYIRYDIFGKFLN